MNASAASATAYAPPSCYYSHHSYTSSPPKMPTDCCSDKPTPTPPPCDHLISLNRNNKFDNNRTVPTRTTTACSSSFSSSTPTTTLSSSRASSLNGELVENGVSRGGDEGGGTHGVIVPEVQAVGVVIDETRPGGTERCTYGNDEWRLPSFLYHAKKAQATFYGSTDCLPNTESPPTVTTSSSLFTFGNFKGFNWIANFIRPSSSHKRPTNSWNVISGDGPGAVDQCCTVVVVDREAHDGGVGGGCQHEDLSVTDNNHRDIDDDDNMETLPILGASRCSTVVGSSSNSSGIVTFTGSGGSSNSSCSGGGRSVGSRFSVLSVSVPNRLTPSLCVALLYSFMPYIITNVSVVLMLLCSSALAYSLIYMLCMWFVVAFLSEAILKNLLRHPRPLPSSVPSFGMPSAHSSTSMAALSWWLLELRGTDGGPWMLFAEMDQSARVGVACLLVVLFLPVPWGRYWLRDHSFSQCLVGGCLGGICGILGYIIRLSFFS
eukprot:GHVS01065332.1.p1 GENE.GHVS01065332.1~~GHVS01065332.1.p1  ORF type:complete len:490 (-),score=112.34 GHVS01065332.1:749-2218(-)